MNRFHALQEFDEGKRSCRRRLAGHNKRRRKTHSENAVNGGASIDEKGSSYLLISLLRILANLHSKCILLSTLFNLLTDDKIVTIYTSNILSIQLAAQMPLFFF